MGSRCGSPYTAADDVFTKPRALFRGAQHLEEPEGRLEIEREVERGILHRRRDVRIRCQVEDDVVVEDNGGLGQERAQRAIVEVDPRHDATEVVEAPAREVVDHGDPCTIGDEVLHDV